MLQSQRSMQWHLWRHEFMPSTPLRFSILRISITLFFVSFLDKIYSFPPHCVINFPTNRCQKFGSFIHYLTKETITIFTWFDIFFLKFFSFFLWNIKKLRTFAAYYNYRRMSKLGTITHPQLLGNKAQGCCAARRNSFFFDTLNVEHREHSNNLLTHIRRIHRLSPLYLYAREALRHIRSERVGHKVHLPLSHARFPTSIS